MVCASWGCDREDARVRFQDIEKTVYPLYLDYLRGPSDVSLTAVRDWERIVTNAPPGVWRQMDRGIYMGFLDVRLSVALENVGNKEESRKYRDMAVREFQHRKGWDAKTQSAQPLTPIPSHDDTEKELFAMVEKLDQARKVKELQRANLQGGADRRQPFSSDTNRTSAAAASRRSP